MSGFNSDELKYYALIFGVVLLLVYAYRKATKKVRKDQEAKAKMASEYKPAKKVEKPVMTEEAFSHSWKNLSFLLLLAGAGNLYMAYNAIMSLLETDGLWVWWIDAFCSIAAAGFAVLLWRRKTKNWVFAYFMEKEVSMTDEAIFTDISNTILKALKKTHASSNKKTRLAQASFEIALKQLVV